MKITIFILILSIFTFSACSATTEKTAEKTAVAAETGASSEIKHISVGEAKQAVSGSDAQFVDVRTPAEYKGGHAVKALNLPLDTLENNIAQLDKNKPVYVICETGSRSKKGAEIMQNAGFEEVYNIKGGTSAWMEAGFPTEKGE